MDKTNKAFAYMAANCAAIGGAVFLGAGAFGFAAPITIPVGAALVATALAVTLFTYAFSWNDEEDLKKQYTAMSKEITRILEDEFPPITYSKSNDHATTDDLLDFA